MSVINVTMVFTNIVNRHTSDPVHSNTLHTPDAISDDILSPCLISLSSADGAQTHVHPIDGVIIYVTQRFDNNSTVFRLELLGCVEVM